MGEKEKKQLVQEVRVHSSRIADQIQVKFREKENEELDLIQQIRSHFVKHRQSLERFEDLLIQAVHTKTKTWQDSLSSKLQSCEAKQKSRSGQSEREGESEETQSKTRFKPTEVDEGFEFEFEFESIGTLTYLDFPLSLPQVAGVLRELYPLCPRKTLITGPGSISAVPDTETSFQVFPKTWTGEPWNPHKESTLLSVEIPEIKLRLSAPLSLIDGGFGANFSFRIPAKCKAESLVVSLSYGSVSLPFPSPLPVWRPLLGTYVRSFFGPCLSSIQCLAHSSKLGLLFCVANARLYFYDLQTLLLKGKGPEVTWCGGIAWHEGRQELFVSDMESGNLPRIQVLDSKGTKLRQWELKKVFGRPPSFTLTGTGVLTNLGKKVREYDWEGKQQACSEAPKCDISVYSASWVRIIELCPFLDKEKRDQPCCLDPSARFGYFYSPQSRKVRVVSIQLQALVHLWELLSAGSSPKSAMHLSVQEGGMVVWTEKGTFVYS